MNYGSKTIARVALRMAISENREEEAQEKKKTAHRALKVQRLTLAANI